MSPGRFRSAQGSEPPRRASGGGENSDSSCSPSAESGGSQHSLGAVDEHRHRIARHYIATGKAALEDQRNRDDGGQNRENQAAAPRASAAVIGTIGHEFRTGTAPRFDLAPVRVGYLPGDEPVEQIHD